MKASNVSVLAISLLPLLGFAGANCQHSQSWQCQQQTQSSGTAHVDPAVVIPPTTAPTGGTTQALGSVPEGVTQMAIKPLGPKPIPTPLQVPLQVPSQVQPQVAPPLAQAVPQPMRAPQQVPSQVPTQALPPQVAPPIAQAVPQPMRAPQQVPSQVPTQALPPQVVPPLAQAVPQPPQSRPITVTSSPVNTNGGQTGNQPLTPPTTLGTVLSTHVLEVHTPPQERPVTAGHHPDHIPYSLEFIEPGIQNHKVEVYRSKDVRQVTYQDINPLDAGGFHLRVIGIRKPEYSH